MNDKFNVNLPDQSGRNVRFQGEVWHDGHGAGVFTVEPMDALSSDYLESDRLELREALRYQYGLNDHADMFESAGIDYRLVLEDGGLAEELRSLGQIEHAGGLMEGKAPPAFSPDLDKSDHSREQSLHIRFGDGTTGIVDSTRWENSRGEAMVIIHFGSDKELASRIYANKGQTIQQSADQLGLSRISAYLQDNDPAGQDITYLWVPPNLSTAGSRSETFQQIKERGDKFVAESQHEHNLERLSFSQTKHQGNTPDR